jgi:hypothetical protein
MSKSSNASFLSSSPLSSLSHFKLLTKLSNFPFCRVLLHSPLLYPLAITAPAPPVDAFNSTLVPPTSKSPLDSRFLTFLKGNRAGVKFERVMVQQ